MEKKNTLLKGNSIILILLRVKTEDLGMTGECRYVKCRRTKMIIFGDFLSEIMWARGKWSDTFKTLKGMKGQQ